MSNPTDHRRWLPEIHRRMAEAAMAFAIMLVSVVAVTTSAQAQTYRVLHTFTGPDGASPAAGLLLDAQGDLYGTTVWGGDASCDAPYGCGTVFKLDPTGKETVLHSFTQAPDGRYPYASLVLDAQSNLFGTTLWGGDASCDAPYGCGTVFELDARGAETVLWSFPDPQSGWSPRGGLVLDAQGNLYGTTESGGGHLRACENTPCGTVFKVIRTGQKVGEDRLYSFTGKADGGNPEAGLVRDAEGNLYGTTTFDSGDDHWGTVFKVSLVDKSWKEIVLYRFTGGPDTGPYGGLLLDAQGNLYGTTAGGGAYNYGTVFKLDTAGNETVLYSFTGAGGDGATPQTSLVLDAQGNLYGTTSAGGDISCNSPYGCGTVFKLDTSGKKTVLHSFTGGADGYWPYAGLVLDAQGNLYGTTFLGGLNSCSNGYTPEGCGVVFKLTP